MKVKVRVKRPKRKLRALAVRLLGYLIDFLIATASGVVAALAFDWLRN